MIGDLAFGVFFLLLWFRSRTFDCTLDDVWIIYVLCEVAIVSRLFILFLFSTWDV